MPLAEDTLLENRYRIDSLLAYGGMGAVYQAFDTNLQVKVAIKENYFSTPQAIEQFKREALILARLRHACLPRVLQHFSFEGQQYLVMELIEGANLWEIIKREGKPFDEKQATGWMVKLCNAVSYLHTQDPPIIHRDIKPQNIKVMPDGQVVLVDFGVAKEGGADMRTATGARGVTPGFSPPEQYSGSGSRPASDIYALGATLYALLTGIKPPDSISLAIGEAEYVPPNLLNPAIHTEVSEAITWAMQAKPNDRPQRVEEWRLILQQVIQVEPVAAKPKTKKSPPPPKPTEKPQIKHSVGAVIPKPAAEPNKKDEPSRPAPKPPVKPSPKPKVPRKAPEPALKVAESKPPTAAKKEPPKPVPETPDKKTTPDLKPELEGKPPPAAFTPEPKDEARDNVCPSCMTENRPEVRFCEECGTDLVTSPLMPRDETGTPPPEEPSTQTCPNCGNENRLDTNFCEECGTDLATTPLMPRDETGTPPPEKPSTQTCSNCGNENRLDTNFCEECGTSLKD